MPDVFGGNNQLRDRARSRFLGYFPTRAMFSRDMANARDMTTPGGRTEEGYVLTALDLLADLVGRTHDDVRGQYYGAQTGGLASITFADDLNRCYDQVAAMRPAGG